MKILSARVARWCSLFYCENDILKISTKKNYRNSKGNYDNEINDLRFYYGFHRSFLLRNLFLTANLSKQIFNMFCLGY